jgi:hypothetical protein
MAPAPARSVTEAPRITTRVRSVARCQAVLQLASVSRTGTGGHPVRRRTSSETAAQRCSRIEANIVEYAYIRHGSSPAIAISAQCPAGVRLAYSCAVPRARAARAETAARPGHAGPVMSWQPPAGLTASAAGHRAASARETSDIRPPAAGSRTWPLARARARNPVKDSPRDRGPGGRDRAPAPGGQPPGVPAADRVAGRRAGVRVQAAQRGNGGQPRSRGQRGPGCGGGP